MTSNAARLEAYSLGAGQLDSRDSLSSNQFRNFAARRHERHGHSAYRRLMGALVRPRKQ